MQDQNELFDRLAARYQSGDVPWDDPLPPPEVIDLLNTLLPGRGLDLGCGYGRASIYMAQRGWHVDGIDFMPQAAAEAARRSRAAEVSARFHICDVVDLDFLAGPYDLALDVGCGHNLSEQRWQVYRDQLRRLLRPGGLFLLFARLKEPVDTAEGPSGLTEGALLATFAEGFALQWHQHGQTDVPGQRTWPSAWYRFCRL